MRPIWNDRITDSDSGIKFTASGWQELLTTRCCSRSGRFSLLCWSHVMRYLNFVLYCWWYTILYVNIRFLSLVRVVINFLFVSGKHAWWVLSSHKLFIVGKLSFYYENILYINTVSRYLIICSWHKKFLFITINC